MSLSDPVFQAVITVHRTVQRELPDMLKVLGIPSAEEALASLPKKDKTAVTRGLLKKAKNASTLQEFLQALDILDYAYIAHHGAMGKKLHEIAGLHGQRWYDYALQQRFNSFKA
jgi:hypothetical protein